MKNIIDAKFFSKAGRKKENQDSVLVMDMKNGGAFLAVADGMGGKPGGKVASKTALAAISDYIGSLSTEVSIDQLFRMAKSAIVEQSSITPENREMGTTLSVVYVKDEMAIFGHVGDCRIYHLRGNGLISRTKDQTEVQRLIDDGILTKDRAKDYHRKNVLLSVLSSLADYDLQVGRFSLEPGDRIVIMSDGAYSLLSKSEIRDISKSSASTAEFIDAMEREIESRKIRDDYTAIIYQYKT